VAGGWTRMRSVRAAKQRALPAVTFCDREQVGAFGAALFAAHAAALAEVPAFEFDLDAPLSPSPSAAFVAAFTAPADVDADRASPLGGPHLSPSKGV